MDYGKQVTGEVLAQRVSGPVRVRCAIKHISINFP
jgi:hypothetical protein